MRRVWEDRGGYKEVVATVEKGPNYIFHLMAVARIGFDSDYAETYQAMVQSDDLRRLWANRELLAFGDGHCGELVPLMLFLPAYLNLESVNAIGEYFDLLDMALNHGEDDLFLARYAEQVRRLDHWLQPVNRDWLSCLSKHGPLLAELGEIYERNFPAYEARVWPVEVKTIALVASRLNDYLRLTDLIRCWEELTGRGFKLGRYEIVLCSAIKNGPNANSLGYDKNVFYTGADFHWLTQFISHEVGTHLLIDDFRDTVSRSGQDFDLVYRAYENLARFFNTMVLGTTSIYDLGQEYQSPAFDRIYRALHAENPGAAPGDLLAKAIVRTARSPAPPPRAS